MIQRAAEGCKILHLKASDLIKARLTHAQSSDELRQGPVLDNQALMLVEFSDRIAATENNVVVFDGHNLIDTPNGLVDIPLSVFEAINPDAIIFVEDDAASIQARRRADITRFRPSREINQLAQQQALARARAAYIAQSLSRPFVAIAPDNIERLVAFLV